MGYICHVSHVWSSKGFEWNGAELSSSKVYYACVYDEYILYTQVYWNMKSSSALLRVLAVTLLAASGWGCNQHSGMPASEY